MKINDKVTVRNVGYTYSNYKSFFKENKLDIFKKMWVENDLPTTQEVYDLVFLGDLNTPSLIKKDNQVYIISTIALRKSEENIIEEIECPYCMDEKDKKARFLEKDVDTITLIVRCEECGREFLQVYDIYDSHKVLIEGEN